MPYNYVMTSEALGTPYIVRAVSEITVTKWIKA